MTDEEKAKQVTANLAGEFYVGQRVRVCNAHLNAHGLPGVVSSLRASGKAVNVTLDHNDTRLYLNTSLEAI